MKTIIHYFHTLFCRHTLQKEECIITEREIYGYRKRLKVSLYCTKCAWHKSFYKF